MLRSLITIMFLAFACTGADALDFGNMTSSTLAAKAWEALASKDWKAVEAYTDKCISLYFEKAVHQQKELNAIPASEAAAQYWALNDVGTCMYIRAKMYREQGNYENAKKACREVISNLSFSQCWDPGGWFWKVGEACSELVELLGVDIDFEDHSSETLTRKAWESLGASKIQNAVIYAEKCISLYGEEAKKQQASLDAFASKEHAFDYWALNDVGTCYFILGEAFSAKKQYLNAYEAYKKVVDEYSYAQCWDPRGWFWKVAQASRGKMNKIKAEQGLP